MDIHLPIRADPKSLAVIMRRFKSCLPQDVSIDRWDFHKHAAVEEKPGHALVFEAAVDADASNDEKSERLQRLFRKHDEISFELCKKYDGVTLPILVEKYSCNTFQK